MEHPSNDCTFAPLICASGLIHNLQPLTSAPMTSASLNLCCAGAAPATAAPTPFTTTCFYLLFVDNEKKKKNTRGSLGEIGNT